MKCSWPRTCIKVFRPDPPRGGSRAGPEEVSGGPILQETSSERKAIATNQMNSNDLEACGKKCCFIFVPLRSQIFDAFVTSFWTKSFLRISMLFYRFLSSKELYLHLFCVISMFLAHMSRRLQWSIVIACRPSSVRPSVVRRRCPSRNFSHLQLLLQNRSMDFDETWLV